MQVVEHLEGSAADLIQFGDLVKNLLHGLVFGHVWTSDPALHAEYGTGPHDIVGDVVLTVTGECHGDVLEGAEVFLDRHEVTDHLKRVRPVVQSVEARDWRILGELCHHLPGLETSRDNVDHTADDFGGVLHGFLHTQGCLVTQLVVDAVSAQFRHCSLQGHAGTQGGLRKEGEKCLLVKTVLILLLVFFHVNCAVDHVDELILAEVRNGEQVSCLFKRHGWGGEYDEDRRRDYVPGKAKGAKTWSKVLLQFFKIIESGPELWEMKSYITSFKQSYGGVHTLSIQTKQSPF